MAQARYHITPTGPKLCSASVRSCPYGDSTSHFSTRDAALAKIKDTSHTSVENAFRSNANSAKVFALPGDVESSKRIVEADDWGASFSDMLDEHIEANGVPKQIDFTLIWENDNQAKDSGSHYIFDAMPRFDEEMNVFTNVYRLARVDLNDSKVVDNLERMKLDNVARVSAWKDIQGAGGWGAIFGHEVSDPNPRSDNYSNERHQKDRQASMLETNNFKSNTRMNYVDMDHLVQLMGSTAALDRAKIVDLENGITREDEGSAVYDYKKSVQRKAESIKRLIQVTENTLMGPVNAYNRGFGFYRLDNDRHTIVEEDLSTTMVRGHLLSALGNESNRLRLSNGYGYSKPKNETQIDAYNRERDLNKPVPYQSPMTFFTSNTPDGARWELGLDVSSPEAGSHRVRYFDGANPNTIANEITPSDSVEGFAVMKEQLEARYGESSNWSPKLQRDMKVLADIVSGHGYMRERGREVRNSLSQAGVYDTAILKAKEEHDSLFGKLGKLFG